MDLRKSRACLRRRLIQVAGPPIYPGEAGEEELVVTGKVGCKLTIAELKTSLSGAAGLKDTGSHGGDAPGAAWGQVRSACVVACGDACTV